MATAKKKVVKKKAAPKKKVVKKKAAPKKKVAKKKQKNFSCLSFKRLRLKET